MNSKNIVIVVHKFHTNPDDDLVLYLNNRKVNNVLHVKHSFSDAKDRCSYYVWYENGTIYEKDRTKDYRWLPEPLIYLKEFIFTRYWIRKSNIKWDMYIGMDGLCANFGLHMTKKYVRKVICWNLDFVPNNRFRSKIKNYIYRKININAFKKVDEMWDHTQKMVEEKKRFLGIKPSDYESHRVVPLGVWYNRIRRYDYTDCEKYALVFLGHLLPKQGVQLVLQAIKEIIKRIPDFEFKIIGSGQYEGELRRLMSDLKIENYVSFLGRIESDQEMENEIAKCSLGIAPYIRNLDTFTQYGGDPGKVKIYLGCGLPVLLTDVPWIAKKIEENGCGDIISEDIEEIAEKITLYLLDSKLNQSCREKAREYAKKFDNEAIFDRIFNL